MLQNHLEGLSNPQIAGTQPGDSAQTESEIQHVWSGPCKSVFTVGSQAILQTASPGATLLRSAELPDLE